MKKSMLFLLISACTAVANSSASDKYIEFKCVQKDIKKTAVWNVTLSPALEDSTNECSLHLLIDNFQINLPIQKIRKDGLSLQLAPWVHVEQQEDQAIHNATFTTLLRFTVKVGDFEVLTWAMHPVSGLLYTTLDFRVHFSPQTNNISHVWIAREFPAPLKSEGHWSNIYKYGMEPDYKKLVKDSRFRYELANPIGFVLTDHKNVIIAKEYAFPTAAELAEIRPPIATALSVEDYINSTEPVWKKPFLLPPILDINVQTDPEEALLALASLQRDVSVAAIRSEDLPYSGERYAQNEKLLEYYMQILSETSPLRGSIEQNLQILKNERSPSLRAMMRNQKTNDSPSDAIQTH